MPRTDEQLTVATDAKSLPPPELPWSDRLRRDAEDIRQNIYRRHSIPESVPLDAAIAHIEMRAKARHSLGVNGGQQSAWANPEERADAREAYARQGRNPEDVRKRWEESIYLLDPRTYSYMKNFGRDQDFLREYNSQLSGKGGVRMTSLPQAIQHYDETAHQPLSRTNTYNPFMESGGHRRFGGPLAALANGITNPDTTGGYLMEMNETLPNTWRMFGSGELEASRGPDERGPIEETARGALWNLPFAGPLVGMAATAARDLMGKNEAWTTANAMRDHAFRYRHSSPHAILDLPAGASPQDIGRRLKELQDEYAAISAPFASERWKRTEGWTPPGWASDIGDLALSTADASIAIPVTRGLGALTKTAKAVYGGARGAEALGALSKAVTPVAAATATDAAQDMTLGTGITAVFGGEPGRSSYQFWFGGGDPGTDYQYKTDDELKNAQALRPEVAERLRNEAGAIENANRAAQLRMQQDGTLPSPPTYYWGMSPSGPAY